MPRTHTFRNLLPFEHSPFDHHLWSLYAEACPPKIETVPKIELEANGGAKASAPEWESGGQRGRMGKCFTLVNITCNEG